MRREAPSLFGRGVKDRFAEANSSHENAGAALDGPGDVFGGFLPRGPGIAAAMASTRLMCSATSGAVRLKGEAEIKEAHEPDMNIADYVKEAAVARGLCDEAVQLEVGSEELAVALLVSHAVLVGGQFAHLVELLLVGALGGQGSGGGLKDELHLLKVVEFGYREGRYGITTEGRDADQAFVLKAPASLTNGGAAGAVKAAQFGLGKGLSGSEFALHDVLP